MSSKMFQMALMMGVMLSGGNKNSFVHDNDYESLEDRNKRLANAKIKQNIARGLSEFNYAKGSVWALNQKSADKKAKKKGYL